MKTSTAEATIRAIPAPRKAIVKVFQSWLSRSDASTAPKATWIQRAYCSLPSPTFKEVIAWCLERGVAVRNTHISALKQTNWWAAFGPTTELIERMGVNPLARALGVTIEREKQQTRREHRLRAKTSKRLLGEQDLLITQPADDGGDYTVRDEQDDLDEMTHSRSVAAHRGDQLTLEEMQKQQFVLSPPPGFSQTKWLKLNRTQKIEVMKQGGMSVPDHMFR
jgi:hypothetical protein